MDQQTKLWVKRWLEHVRRRPDHTMLSPLMDNLDDWTQQEVLNYAGDDCGGSENTKTRLEKNVGQAPRPGPSDYVLLESRYY
ncbi:hypothetical protein CCR75_003187 [Bremia lactucae]|uniref:Uncharacterized protein n=1 Tax=Bremia lactucae TaxID=4779 RepID=A0A976IE92_BRELC|nr:hypothetical protein CCR75_003187 [Bremia lactucae]